MCQDKFKYHCTIWAAGTLTWKVCGHEILFHSAIVPCQMRLQLKSAVYFFRVLSALHACESLSRPNKVLDYVGTDHYFLKGGGGAWLFWCATACARFCYKTRTLLPLHDFQFQQFLLRRIFFWKMPNPTPLQKNIFCLLGPDYMANFSPGWNFIPATETIL